MPRLLLTGGRERRGSLRRYEEWQGCDQALLVELDTDTGRAEARFRYETPRCYAPDDLPSYLFKAASVDGDRLLLCTQTEVLELDRTSLEVVGRTDHPLLNDVHHVARIDGRLHVVSTGLDALLVFDEDGELERVVPALDEDLWQRFDPEVDYRKVATTKPHHSHPNYVFRAGGGTWITRLHQRDAVCVEDRRRIEIGGAPIHDGLPHGDSVWFTRVDGHLFCADPTTGAIEQHVDLNELQPRNGPLGWARGLYIEDDVIYVGFSRLRGTKFGENLRWLRNRVNNEVYHPTRVTAYDMKTWKLLDHFVVDHTGISMIFSVLRA